MLRLLGVPGQKTENCSPATGAFRTRIKTANVGPFRVTGLNLAVDLLEVAFTDEAQQIPDVVAAAKKASAPEGTEIINASAAINETK